MLPKTTSNLSDFVECSFLLLSMKIFADKCVEMKLLIDIRSVLCRFLKKCTGFHIQADLNKSHCIDLFRGQAGWIFCGKGLKI